MFISDYLDKVRVRLVRRLINNSALRISLPSFGPSAELSVISPPSGFCSFEMQQLTAQLASVTADIWLEKLEERCFESLSLTSVNLYPGEHYRLLAALVSSIDPAYVVEIGTYQGLGTLALAAGSDRCLVETFDVVPWSSIEGQILRESDFENGRIRQTLVDLSVQSVWKEHRDRIKTAEIIFLDGPKDGHFEPTFLNWLVPFMRGSRCLLVIDDIRVLPMVKIWADLDADKIDVTSLGHWSGTALVRL